MADPAPPHTAFLGLDAGGSRTRWALVDPSGALLQRGECHGFSASEGDERATAGLTQIFDSLPSPRRPIAGVLAGITGLSRGTPIAARLARHIEGSLKVPQVDLMGDIELLCRCAFKPGEGVLVYAGTGAIAGHVTSAGDLLTAGGRGVRIDDAGGGHWIAARALRHVLREEDREPGSGWRSLLGRRLLEQLKGESWGAVKAAVAELDRGGFARLAEAVGRAAHEGDAVAFRLLERAGLELARITEALCLRLSKPPAHDRASNTIALAGGAFLIHPAIRQSLAHRLGRDDLPLLSIDGALSAARLAAGGCATHDLVTTSRLISG